jgi:hypothetical protein
VISWGIQFFAGQGWVELSESFLLLDHDFNCFNLTLSHPAFMLQHHPRSLTPCVNILSSYCFMHIERHTISDGSCSLCADLLDSA